MAYISNTEPAADDLVERTENGSHSGWNTFDAKYEGARYQMLHELVSADNFDADTAQAVLNELKDFAQSYGYGTADSVLHEYGHLTDEELEDEDNSVARIVMEELFNNDGESDTYFSELNKSELTLSKAARTPEALQFLGLSRADSNYGTLWNTVRSAFIHGRDMKKEEYDAANSPKP